MLALIKRDILLAHKQDGGLGGALGFILAVMVLVPLALGPDQILLQRIAPGLLWLALLLAVLMTSDRIFQQDFEDGSLDVMTMTAHPFEFITFAKAIAHWFTVSLPLALIAPPLGILLNINMAQLPNIWLAMIIGSLALSMLSSIGGAVTAGLRRGGLLVALLILPLYVPVLIFGISESMLILCGVTLISVVVAPFASSAALKAYLR
jgi:heme exporter protein B